jgi:hypothetical protein
MTNRNNSSPFTPWTSRKQGFSQRTGAKIFRAAQNSVDVSNKSNRAEMATTKANDLFILKVKNL